MKRQKEQQAISIEVYRQYRRALISTSFDGQYLEYGWGNLPKSLNIVWLPYSEMFREFSQELANTINQLTGYVHRLKSWNVVIAPMPDRRKLDATLEFVDPTAVVALNLPYVIRSRFIFAVAHLCHQANQSRDGIKWKDDLPMDDEIYFDTADKYGSVW